MNTVSITKKNDLVKIEFYGQEIEAVYDGQDVWIAITRICENLGIDPATQRKKLQENEVFCDLTRAIPLQYSSGTKAVFCLHLDGLTLWLAGISPNRVKEEAQPLLIRYQLECMKALNEYFKGGNQTTQPSLNLNTFAGDFKCFLDVGEMIGLKGNQKVLAANQANKKRNGIDFLEELGQTHLLADVQERLLTPTELGKKIGLSARATNQLITDKELQTSHRDPQNKLVYTITEKGSRYGIYLDTGKKAGGTPVQQIKWYQSTIKALT